MLKSTTLRSRLLGVAISPLMALAFAAGGATVANAKGVSYNVLFTFSGSNGYEPDGNLVKDKAGNVYGTTALGGADDSGAVFKLAQDGTETVLYSFTDATDGGYPAANLTMDKAGNLYGTTNYGGAYDNGVVFKLAPDGTETVLYSFPGVDVVDPLGGLILDKKGNLYGTTLAGGSYGNGDVYEVAANGTETELYAFTGGNDGGAPAANLITDAAGNFYSTTESGGAYGNGTIFKLAPNGTETVLYSFTGGADGAIPSAGLITDSTGNLYGTAYNGGSGYGTIFMLSPSGTETTLYTFTGGSDGAYPLGDLFRDSSGNLYGTSFFGGANNAGVVFKLSPAGTETVLHAFAFGGSDGARPKAGLIKVTNQEAGKGELYGTTERGGSNGDGTIFAVTK